MSTRTSRSFVSRLPTNPSPTALPSGYNDPSTIFDQENYNRTITKFRPSFLKADAPDHQISYAVVGCMDPERMLDTVVWINGLGGQRLTVGFLDGYFASYCIRLIMVDRPGGGTSTSSVPLSRRFAWTTESILAVLAHELIPAEFSILSHSNGVLYSLHLLLHLPPERKVKHWLMTSPFVPPWLSGSIPLTLARSLPISMTSSIGTLATLFSLSTGWYDTAKQYSVGVSSLTSNWLGPATPTSQPPIPPFSESSPVPESANTRRRKQYSRFVNKQASLPLEEQSFGGYFHGPELFPEMSKRMVSEGLGFMGSEALVCLRKGEGRHWGWPVDSSGDEDEDVDEMLLFEKGFGQLVEKLGRERVPKMRVGFGKDDGMIPEKGRKYLKALLVEKLGLVEEEQWIELDGQGHDETLGLTIITEPWLQDLVEDSE